MSKAVKKTLTDQDIQAGYSRYQQEIQSLAEKVGELESEAEEHELVLQTLKEVNEKHPERPCFRMIGGVLVERTVKDIIPALQTNRDGIQKVLQTLIDQYQKKETEFTTFKREHGIAQMPQRA
ncbi:Prefoldin beta-like protein [Dacryopinax primogenitus]|uniref:Prefoldin beta-like protein n=1 Tax=Dacryopinax primogenitus (strain DJM 731) TaxID=1858805 RepID=M5GCP2_DACPD|nr:Prefoldin beta-like protein [Dacryopinax primogenitus]EJU06335.1 Prefoldin beta-like protein [Dacryopinax primogenitus]